MEYYETLARGIMALLGLVIILICLYNFINSKKGQEIMKYNRKLNREIFLEKEKTKIVRIICRASKKARDSVFKDLLSLLKEFILLEFTGETKNE